jgi:hypothetical protein
MKAPLLIGCEVFPNSLRLAGLMTSHISYLWYKFDMSLFMKSKLTVKLKQFAQKEEWHILCDTLASRLLNVGDTLAATLCYICAGNIDKAVEIWSRTLKSEDGGKTYVDLLQVWLYNKSAQSIALLPNNS